MQGRVLGHQIAERRPVGFVVDCSSFTSCIYCDVRCQERLMAEEEQTLYAFL